LLSSTIRNFEAKISSSKKVVSKKLLNTGLAFFWKVLLYNYFKATLKHYMLGKTLSNISKNLRVGVLRGGPSGEYEVSLKTGKHVMDSLRSKEKYEVKDIFIDKNGAWHIDGVARPVERIFPHIDVAVNALHGSYGEDGRVQQILESHNIPFTGSKALGSAIGMNKPLAKKFFKEHGLLTPEHLLIKKRDYSSDLLKKIREKYPFLKLVKPATAGSSLGVSVFNSHEEFEQAIDQAFQHSDVALVEEYVRGREATCGVIEGSDDTVYALHPIEIRDLSDPGARNIWSYQSKYSDDLHELVCPGDFTAKESEIIQRAAVDAHKALGLRHYSRADFIVNKTGVYILEVNTLPGLTQASLFPKALSVAGITVGDFLEHLIALAIEKR
jgi:D-alanine-D-alanine ligase